ncbi:hypothetical protein F511_15145 [Dorcoceras hygrometricum]|uniref:Uncharacterized protein n=1 Tax=Dorcoceras hygrometricum TaxID=472368 RepID=A0A2Z7BB69_9LAMI|nr:hypothetical protein F511_15145 [Dorcoceras hygrometricum]
MSARDLRAGRAREAIAGLVQRKTCADDGRCWALPSRMEADRLLMLSRARLRKHWPEGGRPWAAGLSNGCTLIGATCAMLHARRGGARPCAARMHGGGGPRRAAAVRRSSDSDATANFLLDRYDQIVDRSYDEVTLIGMNRMFIRWTGLAPGPMGRFKPITPILSLEPRMPPRRRGRGRGQFQEESEGQNEEVQHNGPFHRRDSQIEVDELEARVDDMELVMARFQRMNPQTFNSDEPSSDDESWLQHITRLFNHVRADGRGRIRLISNVIDTTPAVRHAPPLTLGLTAQP